MGRGSIAPIGSSPDTLRQTVNRGLGDANMQERGVSFGTMRDGQSAGPLDAVWAEFSLQAGVAVYDVQHELRRVPAFALEFGSENTTTPASGYKVIPWERDKWTRTSLRVYVVASFGNLAGGRITLLVGGER